MPFDGSGNYTPAVAPNFPAVAGTTINSTYYNAVINDLATALSNTLTKDGQGRPSVNFNWNGKNLTNVNALGAVTGAFTGAVTMSSSLAVTGTLSVTGTSSHTGAATFGSTVTATGRATAAGFTSTPTGGGEGGEILLQSVAGTQGFLLDVAATDNVRLFNYQNTPIIISQNNGAVEAMRILPGGNIGINNNAPATKLDVGGTLNASGAVTFGSTLNVTGASTLSSMTLSTPLARNYGGTGLSAAPTNGQVLIGNGSGYALSTITAGSNVSVTNGAGTITISATGMVTSVGVSGGTTGLTTSGGPVTGSGTITLAGTLVVANGGTGSTTASGARTNLGAAASGANNDITSLSALSTAITVAQGGTGSTTAAGARTNLGLGTIATQNANALSIQTPTINSAQIPTISGSAPLFMSRAWVLFQGSGTVTILGSGNVSSITDNGTGNYTVNFTTAMPDANYAPFATVGDAGVSAIYNRGATYYNQQTGSCGLTTWVGGSGVGVDFDKVSFRVER